MRIVEHHDLEVLIMGSVASSVKPRWAAILGLDFNPFEPLRLKCLVGYELPSPVGCLLKLVLLFAHASCIDRVRHKIWVYDWLCSMKE